MPYTRLQDFFNQHPSAALGFSGGVDSAYLLYAGLRCGAAVRPYFVKAAFQPAFELADARRVCQELNVSLSVIELDLLKDDEIIENTSKRCYFCKKQIFNAVIARAKADGFDLVIDGNNASDDAQDRLGMKAAAELQVRSPLRECGLTKSEIRQYSRQAGLFTWNKPAYACLATRVPTGQRITPEALVKIENAENFLHAQGFSDFRVRLAADGAARLQVPAAQMEMVLARRAQINEGLAPYFPAVMMDLKERG